MSVLVAIHVVSGTLAVLAGAIAATVRKGRQTHIRAERWFVIFMTLSSLLGAALGLIRFEQFFITFFAGILGTYLVLSGWRAAHHGTASSAMFDAMLSAANLLTLGALASIGALALSRPDGQMFGFAGENYLFLAVMSGIAFLGDISQAVRKSMSRKHQIARHLWRMLLGFFIAAGSAFTGPGASVFPEAIQASGILSLPELSILLPMIFYLSKTLFFSSNRET